VAGIGVDPDAALLSGDLAHNGRGEEYEAVAEVVGRLGVPMYALPGNHDDRAELRRRFELPGNGLEPIFYAVDVGELRLIALDSMRPGVDSGALGDDCLAWLECELSALAERPTMIAIHHPPIVIGNPAWDAIALAAGDRRALREIVGRHPQVRRIVSGHLHRTIASELAGRSVFVAPSIHLQALLDLAPGGGIELSASEPFGFAVHVLAEGLLHSHVQLIHKHGSGLD